MTVQSSSLHCKENPIYVFLSWELRGLSPNFNIHVSVSDLYISRISPHISLQQNRQSDPGNIYKSLRYMSVGTGIQNIIIVLHHCVQIFIEPPPDTQRTERQGERGIWVEPGLSRTIILLWK
jgi:hypothetical protein